MLNTFMAKIMPLKTKARQGNAVLLSCLLLAVFMALPAFAGESTNSKEAAGTDAGSSSHAADSVRTVSTGSGEDGASVSFSITQSFLKPDGIQTVPQTGSVCTYSLNVSDEDTLDGYLVNGDEDYSITYQQDGQDVSALDTDFQLSGDQAEQSFQADFQHAGVYVFTLKQTTQTVDAFIYDRTVYTLRFFVKNEPSGGLTAVLTAETAVSDAASSGTGSAEKASVKKEQISYENTYAPAITDPPVAKKVTGENGEIKDTGDTFTFELKPDKTGWPLPEGANGGAMTLSLKGNTSGEFGNIVFVQAGTYTYSVAETNKTDTSKYQYDDNTYKYTYTVERINPDDPDDGSLKVVREGGTDPVTFTNIVKNPETEKPGNGGNGGSGNVKTGDTTPVLTYMVLLIAAVCVITAAAIFRRHRH